MQNKKINLIFIFAFIISFIFLGFRGKIFYIPDGDMWSKQAFYFETKDTRQFNFERGYGHPGGPIIEGVIFLHRILGVPYSNPDNILTFFIAIFNSLTIAGTCILCLLLKKNKFWWPLALSTLSIGVLYDVATPPTAIATPLVVFLCLLTLYFYENKEKIKIPQVIFWSLIAGLLIATRIDIGLFCVFIFLILLKRIISWKKTFIVIFGSIISFVIFDPYMWYMPIQHIKDLIFKIIFHYAEILPQHMSFWEIFSISLFAFLGIIFSIIILLSREKIKSFLPYSFIITILIMTGIIYFVFLTANIQTPRYFQPIIAIWEIFLPLFIFPFLPKIFLLISEEKKQKWFIIFLISFQVIASFSLYLFYIFRV